MSASDVCQFMIFGVLFFQWCIMLCCDVFFFLFLLHTRTK